MGKGQQVRPDTEREGLTVNGMVPHTAPKNEGMRQKALISQGRQLVSSGHGAGGGMSRLEKTEPLKAVQKASPNSRQPRRNERESRANAGSHADVDEVGSAREVSFTIFETSGYVVAIHFISSQGKPFALEPSHLLRRMDRTLS